MLKSLTLKDFVIVRALDVEFDAGFSVLTGETGAGKSILIDALQLALGSRAENHVVRDGAARAEITAAFDTPASLASWLEEAGFAVEEQRTAPMRLLELDRLIEDEGVFGVGRFLFNMLRTRGATRRLHEVSAIFRKHEQHLCAVALVSRRRGG